MGGAPVQQLSSSENFAKGCQIEVSSDEEGFKGAWYVATIIDPHPKSSRSSSKKNHPKKVYVQYQSLLDDDDGSKPLREFVNLKFIRPSPPPESEKVQSFELNDIVDAFYRDGWWTGVIARVLDDSKYVVFFQNPPDLIEFGVSELRVHREWVSGKWIRPGEQRTGLMFSKGKNVEVSFEKEDYRDVWFPATVHEETGNGSFLVEYQSTGIKGGSESVKVIVDLHHIQPSPPHLKDKNFVLLEKVDAYIDFGWWSGVITKELADSRFIVFFKSTNTERELNRSEIRPHMEWKDGSWFSASQDILASSGYQGLLRNISYNVYQSEIAVSLGSLGKLEGNSEERTAGSIKSMEKQIELSTPCNVKTYTAMTSLKEKTKLPTPNTDDQHSQPCKKLKEANLIESPSLSPCQLNTSPMDTPSEETHFGFATSTNGDTRTNRLEQSMVGDLPSIKAGNFSQGKKTRSKRHRPGDLDTYTLDPLRRKWGRPPKSPMIGTKDLAGDNNTSDPSRRKGRRAQISTLGSTEVSGGDKKDDAVGCTEENLVEKECVTKEIPVILNLECEVMKGKRAKEPNQIPYEESVNVLTDQKLQLHNLTVERTKEGNQLEGGGETILKRTRGRPRKLPAQIPEASAAVNQQNGGVGSNDMVVKDCMKNEVGSPTVAGMVTITDNKYMKKPFGVGKKILNGSMEPKGKSSSTTKVPRAKRDKLQNGKVVQASAKQHRKHSSKRGRHRTINVNTESLIQDPQDITVGKKTEVCEKGGLIKEVEMTVDQLPNNMCDDQPLSTWFEGMHSPKTVDASNVSQGRNVEQCTEANGSKKCIAMQSLVDDVLGGIVPYKDQNLPFVKNTPIWKAIESMDSFQKIPQKPHFRTLDSCRESFREGLAIGYMVTFASVVEKTSKLQFDDPRSIIEENLETLLDLESHGFDVNKPQNRLTGLLLMKDKLKEFDDRKKERKSLITEANQSNSKLHEKIDKIDNQIRLLHEERALALSAKKKNDSLIASLESTVEEINAGIRSVQLKFEALVAAPWKVA